jgi:hypothetical protein
MPGKLIVAGLVAALLLPVSAGDDPWRGKSKSDVVAALGQPTKTKKSSGGRETLVYKLIRIDKDAPPDAGMRVFELPGVGWVAKKPDPGASAETVSIEPTRVDEEGRPVAGGVTTTHSTETSWEKGQKKTSGEPGPVDEPRRRSKVTVKFVLDAGGDVAEWSVSGKNEEP